MRKWIMMVLGLIAFNKLFAQPINVQSLVDSLQYMKSDSLDCSADIYWRTIAQGEKAIPYLIEKLTDTTSTSVKGYCKSTRLNVGDIAWFALNQIGVPVYVVIQMQFCIVGAGGCWSFYDYLFENANKISIRKKVTKWYAINRTRFRAKKISQRNACQLKYDIRKYFRWRS
jgi:hypothetical protein